MGKGGELPPRQRTSASGRDARLAGVDARLYEDAAANVPAAPYYKALNDKVDKIVASSGGAKRADTELAHVVAGDGALVYPNRYLWAVPLYLCVALYLISRAPSLLAVVLGLVPTYLCYDVYSGVTHVNLDDSRNLKGLKSYLLFQGCLEFQWHHAIPPDITMKPFVAVCADLNVMVLVNVAINVGLLGYTTGAPAMLTGLKLFGAYFGQLCHRSAHTPKHKRPAAFQALMDAGIMCPQHKHLNHHKAPHDKNFCLVGYCDVLINAMLRVCGTNDWLWFAIWITWTTTDVFVVSKILAYAAPSVFAV